jgi:hypothetical protein
VTRVERRWARALLEAFAPTGGPGLAPRAGEVDFLATFTTLTRRARPRAAWGLRLAVWLAALAPMWLWGRLRTITGLDREARAQLLDELLRHRSFPVRELTLLLKLAAAMALLGTESVRARSGYDHVQARADVESGLHPRSLEPRARVRLAVRNGDGGAPGTRTPGENVS